MGSTILTKLNALPIMGDIEVSEMEDIIASICGVTPDGMMKVRARLREIPIGEPRGYSLPKAATKAMDVMDAMNLLGRCAPAWKRVASGSPTWKRVGSFLVFSVPRYSLFGMGPRDPISLIVRTGKSTWKQYDLSVFVITE